MVTHVNMPADSSHRRTAASKGACFCGTVQYSIDSARETHAHCDCTTCRQRPGFSFSTVVAAPAAAFRWLQGEEWITTYDSPTLQRAFCRWCGSTLPMAVQGSGLVFCPMDTLAGDPNTDWQNRAATVHAEPARAEAVHA